MFLSFPPGLVRSIKDHDRLNYWLQFSNLPNRIISAPSSWPQDRWSIFSPSWFGVWSYDLLWPVGHLLADITGAKTCTVELTNSRDEDIMKKKYPKESNSTRRIRDVWNRAGPNLQSTLNQLNLSCPTDV